MRQAIGTTSACALVILLLLLPTVRAAQDRPVDKSPIRRAPEYHLKTAFLYNFAKFVKWPSKSFDGKDAPFLLGVLNEQPLEDGLRVIRGRKLRGRSIVVKTCYSPRDVRDCHMVFLNSTDSMEIAGFLNQSRGHPVLTVGDTPDFAESGGIIRFYVESDKLRFEINDEAARKAGLRVSAQLLEISRAHRQHKREMKP